MPHLDRRMNPEAEPKPEEVGAVKGGVSGNPPEDEAHKAHVEVDTKGGRQSDVVQPKRPE